MGEAFPPDDVLGHWIAILAIALNDLVTVNCRMIKEHERRGSALSPEALYFSRLSFSHLHEIVDRLKESEAIPEIQVFLNNNLPSEVLSKYNRVKEDSNKLLVKLRNQVFHYPEVGGKLVQRVLKDIEKFEGTITFEDKTLAGTRFEFADLLANNIAWDAAQVRDEGALIEAMKFLSDVVTTFNNFAQECVDIYLRMKLHDYVTQLERCHKALKTSS